MADPMQEFLWRFHNSHVATAQHYETQRGTVTTMLLAISTALITLITYDGKITQSDAAAAVFLISVGLFGSLFALKHHERYRAHIERAKAYRDALDQTLDGHPIAAAKQEADVRHERRYRILSSLKAGYWWVALNSLVGVLGIFMLLCAVQSKGDT